MCKSQLHFCCSVVYAKLVLINVTHYSVGYKKCQPILFFRVYVYLTLRILHGLQKNVKFLGPCFCFRCRFYNFTFNYTIKRICLSTIFFCDALVDFPFTYLSIRYFTKKVKLIFYFGYFRYRFRYIRFNYSMKRVRMSTIFRKKCVDFSFYLLSIP